MEGTCLVLELDEYCTQRPTQHKESDVYCCESYYDEEKRVITPLPSTLKKYQHGLKVKKDEVYVFKRPISPQKVAWLKPVSITDCSGDEENYENEEIYEPGSSDEEEHQQPRPKKSKKGDMGAEAQYQCPSEDCPFATPNWNTFRG